MIKLMSAIARTSAYDAGERFADANARTILDQQIRDSTESLESARKAAALDKGLDDLAREGAEEIAFLERELGDRMIDELGSELSRRRPLLKDHELRFRRLTWGRDLMAFRGAAQRLNDSPSVSTRSSLTDAEATLARIEERQAAGDLAAVRCVSLEAKCAIGCPTTTEGFEQ